MLTWYKLFHKSVIKRLVTLRFFVFTLNMYVCISFSSGDAKTPSCLLPLYHNIFFLFISGDDKIPPLLQHQHRMLTFLIFVPANHLFLFSLVEMSKLPLPLVLGYRHQWSEHFPLRFFSIFNKVGHILCDLAGRSATAHLNL
jgi:hypothetical protein